MKRTFLLVALLSSVGSVSAMEPEVDGEGAAEQVPLDAQPPERYKAPFMGGANPFSMLGEEKPPRVDGEVDVEAELKWIEKMEGEIHETNAEIARLREEVHQGRVEAARDLMEKLDKLMGK